MRRAERTKIVAISLGYDPNVILRGHAQAPSTISDVEKSLDKDLTDLIARLKATQIGPVRSGKMLSVIAPVGGAGEVFSPSIWPCCVRKRMANAVCSTCICGAATQRVYYSYRHDIPWPRWPEKQTST